MTFLKKASINEIFSINGFIGHMYNINMGKFQLFNVLYAFIIKKN